MNYPKSIQKKVILLQHFKSYLDGNQKFKAIDVEQFRNGNKKSSPDRISSDPANFAMAYLKKWKRAKKAILFRLSNKIIQVLFQD
jgi:polo-like kinase 1